jgi:glycosyltransferase involved in cell wall biosynthesis
MLGMFDLTHLESARAVRISNLYRALQAFAPVELLSGDRMARRRAIGEFIARGRVRHAQAIYVESSTSTATEMDLFLLALARRYKVPVIVYIPDAYQLFPTLYPRKGLKVHLLDTGWRLSIAAYQRLANLILYPSTGLAHCFQNKPPFDILPPAGLINRIYNPLPWYPPIVTYIGAVTHDSGVDLLLDAMTQVIDQFPMAQCRIVSSNVDFLAQHRQRHAPWLTIERRGFDDLPEFMTQVTMAVIPRRKNRYHDLAVPIKLFDYLSFGKPLVVTDCQETAQLVSSTHTGIVVQDSADGLATGILQLLQNRQLTEQHSLNAYESVQTTHAWEHRANWLWQTVTQLQQS